MRAGDSCVLVGGTLNFIQQMGVLFSTREEGNRLEEATKEDIWKGLRLSICIRGALFWTSS